VDSDELARIFEGERADQQRGVGSDGKRQGENDRRRERRLSADLPQRVLQVPQQGIHNQKVSLSPS